MILTDHDDVDYGILLREARWILDCRGRLSGANVPESMKAHDR